MADQPAKKVRTAAQAAQNARQKAAAEALKAAGMKAFVPNVSYYIQQEKAGKEKETILEEIKQRQAERAAAPKVPRKAKATAAAAAGNGTRNNKPKANAGTAKVRSVAQLAANQKLRNMKIAFNTHKIKYGAPAMKHFKEQKALGRSNSEVYDELKELFPLFAVNNSGVEKRIVTKRAVTAKKAANVVPVANAGNKGAVKGQYICEKCRYVANNTRRNNRGNRSNNTPKNNGRAANNYTYGYYE